MPSHEVLIRRLHAWLDRLVPTVRVRVEAALRALQDDVSVERLTHIVETRDTFALHDLAGLLPARLRPATQVLQRAVVAGGQLATASMPDTARMTLAFDATNPYAIEAARITAASLVTDVTTETRAAIRTVVTEAFSERITAAATARRLRTVIGLSTRQARAVARQWALDVAAGVTERTAEQAAQAFARKLLRARATLIARTEIIAASTNGQVAAWQAAQRKGLLGWNARKTWIVTRDDRLCPACRQMGGQTTLVGSEFHSVLGGTVPGPPLHPACRCAIGLKLASVERAA